MFQKLIAFVLTAVLCLSLTACSTDSAGETVATNPSQNATSKPQNSETAPQEQNKFQETVLVDNDDLLFKITAIEDDPVWGYTLKAQFENKTDKNLMFALDNVSVNGYMCDPFFAATVTAGMKANKDISFSKDSFKEINIKDVTDISLTLRVYDSEDITGEGLLLEDFIIYPLGKEAAKEYPRQPQESDIVLFDNENCTMIVTGFDSESIWGYSANVYLVNKTDDTLMFSVGNAAVNGFMCNPYFAVTVAPGKQCITSINWSKDALTDNNITEVESITLPIRVYDSEDWSKGDMINDTFTVNP